MHSQLLDTSSISAQLHIDDLRREAARRRLAKGSRKHEVQRRPRSRQLQRAPAR